MPRVKKPVVPIALHFPPDPVTLAERDAPGAARVLWAFAEAFLIARTFDPDFSPDDNEAYPVCLTDVHVSGARWSKTRIRACCRALVNHLPRLIAEDEEEPDTWWFTWGLYTRNPATDGLEPEPPEVQAAYSKMEADLEKDTWGFDDQFFGSRTH